MFCSSCGNNIPDGSAVCPICGAPQGGYNDPYQSNYNQPYQAPAPAKSNNSLLIIGIIVAIVAAAAIIVAIILTKKKDDDNGGSNSHNGTYVCDLGSGAEMKLEINGSSVVLSSSAYGVTAMSLTGTITFDGNDVTIKYDDGQYANDYGTYDPSDNSIYISGYTFYKK